MDKARKTVAAQFAKFDAATAECFLAKDREKLFAVIEAGFGDFVEFNKLMRKIFAARVSETRGKSAVNLASLPRPGGPAGTAQQMFDRGSIVPEQMQNEVRV